MEYIYLTIAILLYFPMILADKLGSKGTQERAMLFKYSFYRSLTGILFGGLVLVLTGSKIQLDIYTVLISLLFGLTLALATLVTFYTMQVTTVAVAYVFKVASVIIPCIYGVIFFNESISFINVTGFILFILSVYLIVSKNQEKKLNFSLKVLLSCLALLVVNGTGSTALQLFGKCVPNGNEAVFLFVSYCVQSVLLMVVYLLYCTKNGFAKSEKVSLKMWLYGIAGTGSAFLIQQIMTVLSGNISSFIIFPVTMAGSVIIGVAIGWLWFSEKLTLKNIIGVLGAIVSLMLINMF